MTEPRNVGGSSVPAKPAGRTEEREDRDPEVKRALEWAEVLQWAWLYLPRETPPPLTDDEIADILFRDQITAEDSEGIQVLDPVHGWVDR